MEVDNIGNLLTQLADILNKYYYYAIAAGVFFTIIIVFFALKIRLKSTNKARGKPDAPSDMSSMMMSLLIGSNPEILNKMIADEAKDKEKIIEEIKKFSKIKTFKKVNDSTAEIHVDIDGEEHWYRAKTTADGHKPQILSLSKIK